MKNKILIKHNKNWGLDEARVRRLAEESLRGKRGVELSLVFVGRKTAKELNCKYRNKSYVPQVLSFPMKTEPDEDGLRRVGDVVICNSKLKYEAKLLNKGIYQVLENWLEHGVKNLV